MEVALYIHIPYCVTKCAYCDFFSTGGNHSGVPERYLSALFAELSFRARQYAVTAWRTVYVGGGTPSLLSADQVTRLFAHLAAVAPFLPQAELTVEANPADITEAFLAALTAAGVTRLSCGVQSFSDTVLQAVNRRSDAAAVERALTTIERHWRGELSVDMISGLPDEDTDGFLRGLGRLCALRPEHMSLYALTLEPGTPLSDAVCSGRRAYDYDAADEQWLSGRDFLTEQGYTQYEVSNFCLPSGECVHNMTYWRLESYLGAGAGATGTVFSDDGSGTRWTNTVCLDRYIAFWNDTAAAGTMRPESLEVLSAQTVSTEFFMMGLRTREGVSRETYRSRFKHDFPADVLHLFSQWESRGLACTTVCNGMHRYALTKQGLPFLNRFLTAVL